MSAYAGGYQQTNINIGGDGGGLPRWKQAERPGGPPVIYAGVTAATVVIGMTLTGLVGNFEMSYNADTSCTGEDCLITFTLRKNGVVVSATDRGFGRGDIGGGGGDNNTSPVCIEKVVTGSLDPDVWTIVAEGPFNTDTVIVGSRIFKATEKGVVIP